MDDDFVKKVIEAVETAAKYCTAIVEHGFRNVTSRFENVAGVVELDAQNLVPSIRERASGDAAGHLDDLESNVVASCERIPSGGWFLLSLGMAGILIARGEKKKCGRTPHPSICHCVHLQPPAFHFDQPLKRRKFCAQDITSFSMQALGMGAFLGVANASDQPPKFIHLKYCPPDGVVYKRVAIVGKGICFDSGGYNIKTGVNCGVELMKFDMGGSRCSAGAASAIGALKPKGIEVHFISAVCENMISGKGMRPRDIVTAMNGITIEVNNTDAEGRLTLADSLVYACRLRVDAIVDLATLTGACVVALGNDVGGLFTPSAAMAQQHISPDCT